MLNSLQNILIFHFKGITVDLLDLILTIVLVIFGIFMNRLLIRGITTFCRGKNISIQFARFLKQGVRLLVGFSIFALILKVLIIDFAGVLNYELYANDEFKLRIYNLISVLLIVFVVRTLSFVTEYWFDGRIENNKLDKGRGKSFMQIVKYTIWIVGLVMFVGALGFHITLIIASVSALLIGVGFGLQHIFNDFFSGIIILFDGSVEVDDVVELEGMVGRVLEIGLRVSKVLTRDNVVIIVPNSRFTGEQVINWSHNEEVTRFYVSVGVAYGSDVRLVESILLQIAKNHAQIDGTQIPFVRFKDFGDSSLDFQLYFWTANDFLVENIKSDLRFEIDDQFRKNKVEIPFPQRDLHLKSKHFE